MILANVFQPLIDVADALIVFLHDDVGLSWGWSIVGLTVIVRLAMVPLTIKQIKSMNALRALQPQMKEIQAKYKGDRQKMNQAMMRFYQENKVNPFASCLPLLLQLPVFMALFFLLNGDEFKDKVAASGDSRSWLFVNDITEKAVGADLVILLVLFIASQMASTMVMAVTADKTQQRIMLLLPLVFAAFIPNFPAGLIVYWITTNFWTLGQQLVVRRLSPPPPVAVGGKSLPAMAGGENGEEPAKKKPPPPPRKKKRRRR
jgi:YidC/Oxa1 family membrane protein insertase